MIVMKRFLFVLVALLTLVGCTKSDGDKAAALVKEWLKKNANDPSSIEIVSVGPVLTDSVLSYIEENSYKIKHEEVIRAYEFATSALRDGIPGLAKEYEDKAKAGEIELQQMEDNFKPYSRGKISIVRYRAKNGFGALMLEEKSFLFDDEMTKIIS